MKTQDNSRLIKIITNKLFEDLSFTIVKPYGKQFWVLDPEPKNWFFVKNWYFEYDSDGTLYYNDYFFSEFFHLFSLRRKEYQSILTSWFESNFGLQVNSINRRRTHYEYIIEGISRSEKYKWSIKDRYGFPYQMVSRFLKLESISKGGNVILEDFIMEY